MSLSLCTPSTFTSLALPPSTSLLSLSVIPVTNYSASVSSFFRLTQPSISFTDLSFCNITLSYTHPGQNDNVTVETWLPVPEKWNGRLQALGGGGWQTGRFDLTYEGMNGALGDGYATITTDAGLGYSQLSREWALLSEGNVNLFLLQNSGSVSLADEAAIGKELIKEFYGRKPDYSYWNGCSNGGRQGMMLAQRYPGAYDGIAAGAPGIYWTEVMAGTIWPQIVMSELEAHPYGCEFTAIAQAATKACDGLDGVVDGVVTEIDECLTSFDPFSLVGREIECAGAAGGRVNITEAAAVVSNKTWHGRSLADGTQKWVGWTPGTDLVVNGSGLAATNCTGGTCVGKPISLGIDWFGLFIARNSTFDASKLTHEEYDYFSRASKQQYGGLIETDDPDLSDFQKLGGKLISWHGTVDPILPHKSSERYYEAVSSIVPNVGNFYRHYRIPGLEHCFGGLTSNPTSLFQQLRAWVENGTVPESLPVQLTGPNGDKQDRIVCPYPQRAKYLTSCGDTALARCWECVSEQ